MKIVFSLGKNVDAVLEHEEIGISHIEAYLKGEKII